MFHERLRQLLVLRGMTQRELAHEIDYSEATISKWVQGRALPPTLAVIALCRILAVSADWLLRGETVLDHAGRAPDVIPQWQAVDTTFSTEYMAFDQFIADAQSLFFTSVYLTRAFDSHNPTMNTLIQRGIPMRFVFPVLDLVLTPYDANGLESENQHARKRLRFLHSLYTLQEWSAHCAVQLRLTTARPANNVLCINYDTAEGRILYIPYLYGDFEAGKRPGFIIEQARHPDWYASFHQRYLVDLWANAQAVADLPTFIERVMDQ